MSFCILIRFLHDIDFFGLGKLDVLDVLSGPFSGNTVQTLVQVVAVFGNSVVDRGMPRLGGVASLG